jgi:uncharacterized membrane protein YccC
MVIVLLFNLLKPTGWTVGLIRLEDVVIGSVIGIAIGMAIWPRGASAELARVLGRLFVSGSEYVRATTAELVGPVRARDARSLSPEEARRAVTAAATEAEDVFSQYLAEPHQADAPVGAWSALMASAHQLWFGAAVVGSIPLATGAGISMPELCGQILDTADNVGQRNRRLAARLEGSSGLPVQSAPVGDSHLDRSTPLNVLILLELEAWLGDLEREVTRLDGLVVRLGARASAPDGPVAAGSSARR